jgi:hypothetical protein
MNKREFLLERVSKIETKLKIYCKYYNNRFVRALLVREKVILKVFAILLKKLFGINYLKKTKTFLDREMFVYLSDADASLLYFYGIFGHAGLNFYGSELSIIKFLIKNLKNDDIFYDIGANYGFYTILAQELITNGEIHSFEPNPNIFPLLVKNAQYEKFRNTFLNEIAISDKDGELEFYDRFNQRHSGTSSLIKHSNFGKNIKL